MRTRTQASSQRQATVPSAGRVRPVVEKMGSRAGTFAGLSGFAASIPMCLFTLALKEFRFESNMTL